MSEILAKYGFLLVPIIKVAILVFVVLTLDAYLTWLERKVIAHIQACLLYTSPSPRDTR